LLISQPVQSARFVTLPCTRHFITSEHSLIACPYTLNEGHVPPTAGRIGAFHPQKYWLCRRTKVGVANATPTKLLFLKGHAVAVINDIGQQQCPIRLGHPTPEIPGWDIKLSVNHRRFVGVGFRNCDNLSRKDLFLSPV